jgi:hypothetical protein
MRAEANARAWTSERAPERAPEISFVLVKESADTASGGYAVLLDWRAVALAANDSAAYSSTTSMEKARLRGYKVQKYLSGDVWLFNILMTESVNQCHVPSNQSSIPLQLFVYVSETAEQPIVLTLTEAELHDPLHQHSSSSVENGSRRMASAEGMGLPALLLITLLISLAFSLHPTEIPFSPTAKRSSRTSSQTTSTLAVHSHQRRQCPYPPPAALSQFSYSSTSSPNGFTLFFPFSSSFLSTTFASKTFHSKSRHT